MKPWRKACWCIPPKANAEFVHAMEDVLKVYCRSYAPDEVLVCLDETSKQHTKETRTPLAMRPGQPAGYDFEYERNGTSNLFMAYAPLIGLRHVKVTNHRTRLDFAHMLRDIANHFPRKKIILVMDNLNTHKLSTLYDAFPCEEAGRLADCFEVHHTPKLRNFTKVPP